MRHQSSLVQVHRNISLSGIKNNWSIRVWRTSSQIQLWHLFPRDLKWMKCHCLWLRLIFHAPSAAAASYCRRDNTQEKSPAVRRRCVRVEESFPSDWFCYLLCVGQCEAHNCTGKQCEIISWLFTSCICWCSSCLCVLAGLKRSYSCEVCSVTLNSVAQYHAHLQGSKHQNKWVDHATAHCSSRAIFHC